jgi:25S rRNA (uracil2634-N3)-methyltransferase
VKPYSHWHIETSLTLNTTYHYLGNETFNFSLFKHYMVRKVDRDKCVKLEASDVHIYSDNTLHPIKKYLTPFSFTGDKCCPLCRKGPFANANDWKKHQVTRLHKSQQQYHDMWTGHCNIAMKSIKNRCKSALF